MFELVNPGTRPLFTTEIYLNKLGRNPLGDATYQTGIEFNFFGDLDILATAVFCYYIRKFTCIFFSRTWQFLHMFHLSFTFNSDKVSFDRRRQDTCIDFKCNRIQWNRNMKLFKE